jgi:hypothetical protein
MHVYDNISLNSSEVGKCLTKVVENIKTDFAFRNIFPKVYEIMWKNTVEPERPQMTTEYGACALHAG